MARWMLIGLLTLAPHFAAAQAAVSLRVDGSTMALAGDYRLFRDREWAVSATGSLEQPSPGATSLTQGMKAQYGFGLGSRPATLSLNYSARRDWQGASGLDTGQSGTLDLGWQPMSWAGVGLFTSLARLNFDHDGADSRLDSPDGSTRRSGVRGSLALGGGRTVQGTVAQATYDAEGANLVSRGMAATLQYTHLLARRWSLGAGADYARTRYTQFVDDPARASALYACRFSLAGPLMRRLTASLSYALSRQTWNQDPLVRTETILLSLTYTL